MELLLFIAAALAAAALQLILCTKAPRLWLRALPAALCLLMLIYAALRFLGIVTYPGDAGMLFDRGFTTGILLGLIGLAVLLGVAAGWVLHFIRDWRKTK